MRQIALLVGALGLAAGTVACGRPSARQATVASDARLPVGAFILSEALIPPILEQCSRVTPPRGEGSWTPTAGDIEQLEKRLPAALRAQPQAEQTDFGGVPIGWWRQYVGIVRDGRRFIYGNFFTAPDPRCPGARTPDYAREVAIICDGGPDFFGVEFDVEAGRFTHFGFNGAV